MSELRSNGDRTEGDGAATQDPTDALRAAIQELDRMDTDKAAFLDGLAFVLTRVADADDSISAEERREIERILQTHARLPRDLAVLVTEIARHRRRLADCACAYRVSKELRTSPHTEGRTQLLRFLLAVARADGQVDGSELGVIRQIAVEIGCSAEDLESLI